MAGDVEGSKDRKNQHLEDRVTYIRYELPRGRSSREVSRNYPQALQKAGFRRAL
jgi:hypothetical protein